MDIYYEQTVVGERKSKNALLYALCWVLIVVFALAAVMFGANVLPAGNQSLHVNWVSAVGMVICLAAAIVLFMRKDALHMEYDYILCNDKLEIYGILNARRRKRLAVITLSSINGGGQADNSHCASLLKQNGVKTHTWCGDNNRSYLYYMEENARHLALLELDQQMSDLIRRRLPVGVWRDAEGKSDKYASLS